MSSSPADQQPLDVVAALAGIRTAREILRGAEEALAPFICDDVEPAYATFIKDAYEQVGITHSYRHGRPMWGIRYGFTIGSDSIDFTGEEYEHGSTITYTYSIPMTFVIPQTREHAKTQILTALAYERDTRDQSELRRERDRLARRASAATGRRPAS